MTGDDSLREPPGAVALSTDLCVPGSSSRKWGSEHNQLRGVSRFREAAGNSSAGSQAPREGGFCEQDSVVIMIHY